MIPDISTGLLWYIVFLYSTVFHEAAHAWSALRLGDDTAFQGGQVSLNPWPHLRREPIGMALVPVASWLLGGWLMGWASAPISVAWARQFPRRAALVAVAGPAANLAIFLLAGLLIRALLEWQVLLVPYPIRPDAIAVAADPGILVFVAHVLSIAFSLNLLLFVFNLIPVPPLDGSNVPLLFLPERAAASYYNAMRSPMLRFVGLMIILRGCSSLFTPLLRETADLLYTGIKT